jgi:hypothetical protein
VDRLLARREEGKAAHYPEGAEQREPAGRAHRGEGVGAGVGGGPYRHRLCGDLLRTPAHGGDGLRLGERVTGNVEPEGRPRLSVPLQAGEGGERRAGGSVVPRRHHDLGPAGGGLLRHRAAPVHAQASRQYGGEMPGSERREATVSGVADQQSSAHRVPVSSWCTIIPHRWGSRTRPWSSTDCAISNS